MDDALQYANQGINLEEKVLSSLKGKVKSYLENSSHSIALRLSAAALLGIFAVSAVPKDLMAEIYGKVYDDSGNPLQGAVVIVYDASYNVHSDNTNFNGEFNIPTAEMEGATVHVLQCPEGTYTSIMRQNLDNGQWDFILMKHNDDKYNTYDETAWDQWRELLSEQLPNGCLHYYEFEGQPVPIFMGSLNTTQKAQVEAWLQYIADARSISNLYTEKAEAPEWYDPGGEIKPGEGPGTIAISESDPANPENVQVREFTTELGSFVDDIGNRRVFCHELCAKANILPSVSYQSVFHEENTLSLEEDGGQGASYLNRMRRHGILARQIIVQEGRRVGNRLYDQARATPCEISTEESSWGAIKSLYKD